MMPVARPLSRRALPFRSYRKPFSFSVYSAAALAVLLLAAIPVQGSTPVIYLIEPFLTNQVLVHFDTDANRTYTLQYTDKIGTNGFASSTWSNLYKAPLLPFPNHYIVVDYRTNKMRFYRLSVTP
jgi:hypothetical protein